MKRERPPAPRPNPHQAAAGARSEDPRHEPVVRRLLREHVALAENVERAECGGVAVSNVPSLCGPPNSLVQQHRQRGGDGHAEEETDALDATGQGEHARADSRV